MPSRSRLRRRENGGLRVTAAHLARPSTGVALLERGHRPTLSRHRSLSVPRQNFPCTSGTEARVRVLQRPLSGEGGRVGSGRDTARLALPPNSGAQASRRQTQALSPGLRPKAGD